GFIDFAIARRTMDTGGFGGNCWSPDRTLAPLWQCGGAVDRDEPRPSCDDRFHGREIADLCCIRRNCVRHRSNERTVVTKQSCGRAGIQHSLPAADVTMMTKMTPFCPT